MLEKEKNGAINKPALLNHDFSEVLQIYINLKKLKMIWIEKESDQNMCTNSTKFTIKKNHNYSLAFYMSINDAYENLKKKRKKRENIRSTVTI